MWKCKECEGTDFNVSVVLRKVDFSKNANIMFPTHYFDTEKDQITDVECNTCYCQDNHISNIAEWTEE